MVWFGMLWYGLVVMVWFGSYGMVWYVMVWFGSYSMVSGGMERRNQNHSYLLPFNGKFPLSRFL